MIEKLLPHEIENESFAIITRELGDIDIPLEHEAILKRVIHTSADFEYAKNLVISADAVAAARSAFDQGCYVVTDTNMALAGISKPGLAKVGAEAFCFIADEQVARAAKQQGTTRATQAVYKAAQLDKPVVFVVGNAPTALIALDELMAEGKVNPALVIGVPVGFVNVVESKELILKRDVPHIVARGRKGGSNVAAAIVNALLYQVNPREGFKN